MIHQYKLGNLCVVLDVCSGSVHAVDEVAYDMIAGFEMQERETLECGCAGGEVPGSGGRDPVGAGGVLRSSCWH